MKLTIPMEPPSVNNYVRHTRAGRHYKTREALAWASAVAVIANGCVHVEGKAHEITFTVYRGFKSRGDIDNAAKCVLDSLVTAGVLKSDASVVALHCYKRRDRENPRTEITIVEFKESA